MTRTPAPVRIDPDAVLAALRPVEGRWVAVPGPQELPDREAVRTWADRLAAEVEPDQQHRLREALELVADPDGRGEDPELVQLAGWRDSPTTATVTVADGGRPLLEMTAARREGEGPNDVGGRIRTRWVDDLPTPAVHESEVDPGDARAGWLARSLLLVQVRRPGLLGGRRVVRLELLGDETTVAGLTGGAVQRVRALLTDRAAT